MVTVVIMPATSSGSSIRMGSNPGGSVGGVPDHAEFLFMHISWLIA